MSTAAQWAKDPTIPPKTNEAVSKLMSEQGVTRRRAYQIIRARNAAAVDISTVGHSQRMQVMHAIINTPHAREGVRQLVGVLHEQGYKIDQHDAAKTLWSLQKTRWVTFREKAKGDLYAIRVTDKGLTDYEYASLSNGDRFKTVPTGVVAKHPVIEEAVASVALDRDITQVVESEPEEEPGPEPVAFDPPSQGFPLIDDLVTRWDRAEKVRQAAALLEEAGAEDIAIAAMDLIQFNPLEREVIAFIRKE